MTALAAIVFAGAVTAATVVARNLALFRTAPRTAGDAPAVSVLIPVRDEQAHVEAAVRAACAQASDVEVVVLDDGSTDDTPRILRRLAGELPRVRVVGGRALPHGWSGKTWACWQLATEHARHDWLLFVDCDVRLTPDAVRRAVAAARAQSVPFLSAFPRQITGSVGEALIVPLIHLVLLTYLPMWLVGRSPRPALAAGCGQFVLVQRAAYVAAGGHRAVRASLHDGLQLARHMKREGFPIGVLDGTDVASCRMYEGLAATWRGFARNAYEGLGSPAALAAMVSLNTALFVLPFVAAPVSFLRHGVSPAALLFAGASVVVVAIRARLAARFRTPLWTALATPLAVTLMVGIQLHSFINTWLGRRITWRSRTYRSPRAAPETTRAAAGMAE